MRRTLAVGIWAILTASGCASGGNEVLRGQDASIVNANIIDGKTTQSEVEKLYGQPTAKGYINAQNEQWTYRWVRASIKPETLIPVVGLVAGGRDVQKKELVVLFNEQNVVVRHSMTDTRESVRTGLGASSSSSAAPTEAVPSVSSAAAATPGASAPGVPASTGQIPVNESRGQSRSRL